MYSEQDLDDLRRGGKIVSSILKKIEPLIVPGRKIMDLADVIEKSVRNQPNAIPAFPTCISANEIAAHDTAGIIDDRVVPDNGILKIDLGVSINLNLVDCARSFGIGEYNNKIIEASKKSLEAAIAIAKPGIKILELGKAIQSTIASYGLKPVRNLTGHSIEKGILHAGISIPNIGSPGMFSNKKLEEGMLIAIEPFATDGSAGYVLDAPGKPPLIFSAMKKPKTLLGKEIWNEYKRLPFSARNAARFLKISLRDRYKKITKVSDIDGWASYAPLMEKSKGMVAQSEDTIYLTGNGNEIITHGRYE
ncbi:MAG: type II methionyl aminopeptidase [Candidatus Hodarchaeales archaeon]|jgi:methionyl aminopeptidase